MKRTGISHPVKLYRSAALKGTLHPVWEPFTLSVADVGGIDGEFTVNCYDWNKDGAHALIGNIKRYLLSIRHLFNLFCIGSVTTTLWEFTLGWAHLALINPAKVGRFVVSYRTFKCLLTTHLDLYTKHLELFQLTNLLPCRRHLCNKSLLPITPLNALLMILTARTEFWGNLV